MALYARARKTVFFVAILSVFLSTTLASRVHAQADIGLSALADSVDPVNGQPEVIYGLRLFNYGDQTAQNTRVRLPLPNSLEFVSVSPKKQCAHNNASASIECDFGSLPAEPDSYKDIFVNVRPKKGMSENAVRLVATASTSSVELITKNNSQSETTTFPGPSPTGVDIAITRFEEIKGQPQNSIRSFELIVRNSGVLTAPDAKLIVTIPGVLGYVGGNSVENCQFNHEYDQLSCPLQGLEPALKGGEDFVVRFDVRDDKKSSGAVKISALIVAGERDTAIQNDQLALVVTLGAGDKQPLLLDEKSEPDATAAIEEEAEAEPVNAPAADPAEQDNGGGDPAPAGDNAGGKNADNGGGGGALFKPGEDVFAAQNPGPSGGDVDFQIQSFEVAPNEIPAGSNFTLTAELLNNGPGIANNATLDITVPEGVGFVSGPGSCVHDGNPPTGVSHVLCSFGNIASGASQSVPVVFQATIAGRVVRNFSGVIDSSSDETNPGNNTQTVGATITNGADLLLTINGLPNPAVAGGNVTYDLEVTNQGLNIAEGASVSFNLPPGITYVGAGSGGNGWSCGAAGQVVTCSRGGNIAATNGTTSFSIVGLIGVGSGTYTASGSVTSTTTPDVDGSNDGDTFDLQVQPGTDLSVAKSVSQNPMYGGSTPTFTITVTNNGPIAAQNLVLTDTLPANFGYVSAVGAGWTCGNAGQLVTCTRPNLAVGSSDVVITVNAPANNLIPEAGTNAINSAGISSDTNDAVAGNDTGSVSFALQRDGADLRVTLSRSPNPVAQGSDITNSVRIANNGPRIATGNVRATYLLAAGETYKSFSGTNWGLNGQVGNLLTFEWTGGAVAVNGNVDWLTVVTTATGAGVFSSQTCTSNGLDAGTDTGLEPNEGDPVRSNNCASAGVTSTVAIADLVVGKAAALDPLTTGDATQTYTLTVRNDGPDTAVDVHLTDTISNWVAAYDDRPATTVTAFSPAGTCTVNNAAVACDLNDILNGATATVTVTVTRPVSNGAAIVNTASAYSHATGDNNRANNVASVTTQVDAVTDLKLRSAIWSPNPVKAGVNATYVITFRNSGPSTANAVTLQSQFGGDFTFISATPSAGACSPFGNVVANQLNCVIGDMASGNQQTVTVIVRPNHPAGANITNLTTVGTDTHETNLANNSGGTDLAVVAAQIDLGVTQTDRFDPVGYNPIPGVFDNRIIYQIDVTNHGPSYATGVTFTDSFTPPGGHRLQFVCDMDTNTGQCAQADAGQICVGQGTIATGPVQENVTCTVKKGAGDEGELTVGESYRRFLIYKVLDTPVAGGETHHKQVVISANENDPIPANDEAVEQTTVRIRTDVSVVCAAPPASVSIRQPFTLQVAVTNGGPGASQETTFAQNLPAGMELTATPTFSGGGVCTGNAGSTSYSCDLGNMADGANGTMNIPVKFSSFPAGGTYTTSASVTTNEVDTNTGNNNCTTAVANVTRASIAGYVYEDHNDDGDMDGGETPIQGVTVTLTGTDAYGNNTVGLTRVTDANGYYIFTDGSPSGAAGYTLTESHPAGYADGLDNAGGGAVVAGSRSTDVISSIALAAGEDKVHYDFGELTADLEVVSKTPSIASVSLRQPFNYTIVVRNNGPVNAPGSTLSDPLPAGMELTGPPTTVPAKVCTGVSGDNSFICTLGTMAKNDVITVTVPVMVTTYPVAGSLNNTATAATTRKETTLANNAKTTPVTVTKSSIACVVYQDYDNLGTKGVGEPGIGNVAMSLTGTDDFGNPVNLVTSTLPDGSCLFDNLSPSTAGNGGGYTLTETQPAGFNDGLENNSGVVGETGNVMANISLAANTSLPTHQFGELPPTGLSGTVWCDDNNNGAIDGAEATRIEGATITLTGPVNDVTTTDLNGNYRFENLVPGNYTITQTQFAAHGCNVPGLASSGRVEGNPQGTADNADASATYGNVIANITIAAAGNTGVAYNFGELRPASLAGTVFNDTSIDDVKDVGEPGIDGVKIELACTDYRNRPYTATTFSGPGGVWRFVDILPTGGGGCSVTQTQPPGYIDGAEILGTVDGGASGVIGADEFTGIDLASEAAGIDYHFAERSAGISGYVYVDRNNDGKKDAGELPISGVLIRLTGTDADGAVARTAVTDANGYYLITGLKASTGTGYALREVQPLAWVDGKDRAGSLGGVAAQDDRITGINLLVTDLGLNYNFGERGGSLSGHVYTDLDNDGIMDPTESGIPGATLNLACTDLNDEAVVRTATTAENGRYVFRDLPATAAAGCTITEDQPANTTDGKDRIGSLGGTVGDDVFSAIPLLAGEHGTDYDFGEVLTRPARVRGSIWHDSNHDRSNNDNQPQANWTVELIHRDVASDCQSNFKIIATQKTNARGDYAFKGVSPGTYGILFRSPAGGFLYAGAQSGGSTGAAVPCGIGSIVVASGDNIIRQDLPLDPSGVVYDALTRVPVPGATVTISGPAGFFPRAHLVGGVGNVTQTTGDDGYYQFLLFAGAPRGVYRLSVGQPEGYIPEDSTIIPACSNRLAVNNVPAIALVQRSDTAPRLSVRRHNRFSCPVNSAALSGGAGTTQYYFAFDLDPGLPSSNVINNHIPLDPVAQGALTVSKTTPKVNVSIGQLVPYTITAINNLSSALTNIELEDQLPPGFKYKRGSASIDGVRAEPVRTGRQLTWPALTFNGDQTRIIKLLMIVGSGVSEGEYINTAWAENGFVQSVVSNVATAKVRVTPDPTFDCAGVIGKVFDDKNRNGYQDKGEKGLANVRLATVRGLLVTTDKHGRYHVACADVPNPDRGSNFIMKLDSRTLPSGYRLTTENPRMIRLTRGKIGKLNFGVAIHRIVRLDINKEAFTPRGDKLKRAWRGGISQLVSVLDRGPSILRIAYARQPEETRRTVRKRINLIKKHVTRLWRRKRRRALVIETESYLSATGSYKGRSYK